MPFFETRRIQSARPVTRAAPVRIVANEFDVAAARLPALPGRAGFDYPVTACLQHLPFTSVPSFARSLRGGGGHALVEDRQPSACCGDGSSRHHASVRAVHGASHGRRQGQHRRRPAGCHRDRDRRRRCQARGLDIAGRLVHGVRPGNYSVSAAHVGFRTALQQRQAVAAGGTLTVDFTLETNLVTNLTEEITVTAMKREDVVRKVPFSMTATSEETLRMRGATDIEDVAANVGGFSVQNLGPGQSQVAIRGVSSGQIARDQPGVKEQAGFYLDESVISLSLFTPDIDLFDLSRVEVLRGPQGTLFGSGSESGTVRYITNQPELGLSKYFGEVSLSTVNDGGPGGYAKVGFNAP